MPIQINVGVFDWGRFAAGTSYYPDDLPTEWQLSYFANDFGCACVRLSDYILNPDFLVEVCEDLPAAFDLSLLIDAQSMGLALDRVSELSLYALVIDDDIYPELTGQLATRGIPLPDTMLVKTSLVQAVDDATRAQCCVKLTDIENLRVTRQWISTWAEHWSGSDQALNLWLDAALVTPQQLDDLRAMLELMGL